MTEKDVEIITKAEQLVADGLKPGKASSIELAWRVAIVDFLFDREEQAICLLRPFCDIKFVGNFNVWTFVEYGLLLLLLISDRNGNKLLGDKAFFVLEDAIAADAEPDEWRNLIARICNNGPAYLDDVQSAIKEGDIKGEIESRTLNLAGWIYIAVYNKSDKYSKETALAAIEAEKLKLRSLMESHGLKGLYPFSKIKGCTK